MCNTTETNSQQRSVYPTITHHINEKAKLPYMMYNQAIHITVVKETLSELQLTRTLYQCASYRSQLPVTATVTSYTVTTCKQYMLQVRSVKFHDNTITTESTLSRNWHGTDTLLSVSASTAASKFWCTKIKSPL